MVTPDLLLARWTEIRDLLTQIRDVTVEPVRRSDTENIGVGIVRRVRVVTVGTAVQGPNIPIPKGYKAVIRQRRHAGSPTGYVGFSSGDVGNSVTRIELGDGDSFSFNLNNMDEVWFDADTANVDFEIIVET